MPIVEADLKVYLSGGAGNSDPNASLGGVISTTELNLATLLHNLFDQVSSEETSAGDTEYRCVYWKNEHGTLTWQDVKAWIASQTPSGDTSFEIGLGTSAVNGTEQTVANESTAPGGVTFGAPANKASGYSVGNMPAGEHKAIWFKRIINAGAAAYNNDGATPRLEGDTAA